MCRTLLKAAPPIVHDVETPVLLVHCSERQVFLEISAAVAGCDLFPCSAVGFLDRALSALDDAVARGDVIAGFTPNGHASYLTNLLFAMAEEDNLERQIPLIDRKVIQSLIGPSRWTALFKRVALDGREVTFFYALQGRVEFPFLPSQKVINRVWAGIRKGYPAELTAAHYLTVIPNGTADYLKAMVRANLQEAVTPKRMVK